MSQIAPVEEFGRETMSSIPDEAQVVKVGEPDFKFERAQSLDSRPSLIEEENDIVNDQALRQVIDMPLA